MSAKRRVVTRGLPELSVQMLALFETSERLTLAQMEEQLGANRNTLKVRLRELCYRRSVEASREGQGDLVHPSMRIVATATIAQSNANSSAEALNPCRRCQLQQADMMRINWRTTAV